MYIRQMIEKNTSVNAHSCIKYFEKAFPGTEHFSPQKLFEESNKGAHDLCGTIQKKWKEDRSSTTG